MELAGDAQQIVTELVENSLLHTVSPPRVRLELRAGLLSVAVSDDSPQEAVLREPGVHTDRGVGLRIVADRAHSWGCLPRFDGGKVVWAGLRTPERASWIRRER